MTKFFLSIVPLLLISLGLSFSYYPDDYYDYKDYSKDYDNVRNYNHDDYDYYYNKRYDHRNYKYHRNYRHNRNYRYNKRYNYRNRYNYNRNYSYNRNYRYADDLDISIEDSSTRLYKDLDLRIVAYNKRRYKVKNFEETIVIDVKKKFGGTYRSINYGYEINGDRYLNFHEYDNGTLRLNDYIRFTQKGDYRIYVNSFDSPNIGGYVEVDI